MARPKYHERNSSISGGYHGGFLGSTEIYNIQTNTIEDGPDLPSPIYGHVALRRKSTGIIYFLGGLGNTESIPWIHSFDTDSNAFKLLPPRLLMGKSVPLCALLDSEGLIVIAQGFFFNGTQADTVEILDLTSLTITSAQPTQQATGRPFVFSEQIFWWHLNNLYEYDVIRDHWYTVQDLPLNMNSVPFTYVAIQADLSPICQYI